MHSSPTDVTPVAVAVTAAVSIVVVISRLSAWHRSQVPRLRLLTGTQPQRAAIRSRS
jgi:hypothetical protein